MWLFSIEGLETKIKVIDHSSKPQQEANHVTGDKRRKMRVTKTQWSSVGFTLYWLKKLGEFFK